MLLTGWVSLVWRICRLRRPSGPLHDRRVVPGRHTRHTWPIRPAGRPGQVRPAQVTGPAAL